MRAFILNLLLFSFSFSIHAQHPVDAIIKKLQQPNSKEVLVAAHRGDWRNAPENSLLAVQYCINMGVDIIEVDIKKTKDGHLVIMHDETIDRTTNGKGKVSDFTLDSLRKLNLRNGYRLVTRHKIPTLEEVMLLVKGKAMVNLDHCYPYIKEAVAVLEKTGTVDHAIFKGTKPHPDSVIADIGSLYNQLTYMPIVVLNDTAEGKIIKSYQSHKSPVAFELVFNNDKYRLLDSISYIRKTGSRVWVNTLWPSLCAGRDDEMAVDEGNPDESWGWLIDKGFNIIQTDRPKELLEYLRKRGLHD